MKCMCEILFATRMGVYNDEKELYIGDLFYNYLTDGGVGIKARKGMIQIERLN